MMILMLRLISNDQCNGTNKTGTIIATIVAATTSTTTANANNDDVDNNNHHRMIVNNVSAINNSTSDRNRNININSNSNIGSNSNRNLGHAREPSRDRVPLVRGAARCIVTYVASCDPFKLL